MELHKENPFKIRSYQSAYNTLRRLDQPLTDLSDDDISSIKGVGKAISGKIRELIDTGKMNTLERYKEKTPLGIQQMLEIKGFGPKKIKVIWDEFGVESIGELLYAINENRLVELKGFGKKTQDDLKEKLEFFQKSQHQFRYASVISIANSLLEKIQKEIEVERIELTGAIRRGMEVLDKIELIVAHNEPIGENLTTILENLKAIENQVWEGTFESFPIIIHQISEKEFVKKQLQLTGSKDFVSDLLSNGKVETLQVEDEASLFASLNLPFIPPECREYKLEALPIEAINQRALIDESSIKGVLHVHTTYSDGLHTLAEMVNAAKEGGYEYIGITDHSKSAVYANGLPVERVLEQSEAIDRLNEQMLPFKIFKGIESDILADGSLDYEVEFLKHFDFIIASIHSNLKMDEAKATNRLIKAIENPYTTIIGHPTGRLLLSRKGYSFDVEKVIDACAANQVAIELNANPYRLDLDWRFISKATAKGVYIAINPDAHSIKGIKDLQFGVLAARKGLLLQSNCLNCCSATDFEAFIAN